MVIRRIWTYTKEYKRLLFSSTLLLSIVVILDLAMPFIIKTIIDDHIVGIEKPWYLINESQDKTVKYEGNYYIQGRYLNQKQKTKYKKQDNMVRILLIDNEYYFVDEYVEQGKKEIINNTLYVNDGKQTYSYKVDILSRNEVFSFYSPSIQVVARLLLIFLVISVLSITFSYYYRLNFSKLGNKVTYDIRSDAFNKLQKLHISYYDQTPAGKIVARVTNDTETIIELFTRVLIVFLQAFIYFIGIYVSLYILDIKLATISLLIIPIILLWGRYYRKKAKKYNETIRNENSEINAYINQSIKGMEVIQAFNREEYSYERFKKHNDEYLKYKNKMVNLNASLSGNMVRLLHRLILIIILLYFGWGALGIHTIIQAGVIYAFVEYMNKLINPINQIFGNIEVLEQSLVSTERVFYLLDQNENELYEDLITRFKGDIEFQGLNFSYDGNVKVLSNINLKVNQGDTVALVGHTGSGKSSMMNVLLRYYDFTEGLILIDGVDIRSYTKQAYRQHIGIVLQDPVLFTGTIASNISLNNPLVNDEMIISALRQIGADQLIENYQKGIYEPVLDMGSNFSLGERQLISFARAMLYDPAVLVLDEATANIDTETEQIIQKALQVVKTNRTTFIIAHRLSTIKDANQIVVLEKGHIIEKGTHGELMNLRGKYFEMHQSQMEQI